MNNTVVYCNDQQHWTVFKGCKQSDFGARMTKLFLEHHSNRTVRQPELYLCITICLTWEHCILSYLFFVFADATTCKRANVRDCTVCQKSATNLK